MKKISIILVVILILAAVALPAYARHGNGNGNGGMRCGAVSSGECRLTGEYLTECPGYHSVECINGLACAQGVDCPIRDTRTAARFNAGKHCKSYRACELCGYTAP